MEFVITDIAEADIGKLAFFVGSLGGNMQVRATDAKHKKTAAAPKKRPAWLWRHPSRRRSRWPLSRRASKTNCVCCTILGYMFCSAPTLLRCCFRISSSRRVAGSYPRRLASQ